MWDVKGNCAKGRSKEALQINRDLDNIKAQIIKHYQRLSDREAFVTAEMVRNAYQGLGSEYETLLGAFDKDNEKSLQRVGKDRTIGTYHTLVRARNRIASFIKSRYRRSDIAIQELATDKIVDVNGDKWIMGKRHKTGIPYQVKLMDIPLQIMERYKHLQEDKLVFGKINYWTVCKKIKTVMAECGIKKSISMHCARHGYATLALSKGVPIESVSSVLGHTNIITTQIYAKITAQKLDTDLTMLSDKLNASFSNIKIA